MTVSRRIVLLQVMLGGVIEALIAKRAGATETVTYTYDDLGRLARAQYANGCAIDYTYDPAGNRTQLTQASCPTSPPPSPSGFNQTIQITGAGPVNLRTLADAAGYNGAQNATVVFQLASNVTISGAAGSVSTGGGRGIDTGTWPSGSYAIALSLDVSGKAYGGGGGGGKGAVSAPGSLGTAGGDALYAQENITVTVNAGGELKAGGGGGGGGGGRTSIYPTEFDRVGGGGGGGFPNGAGGAKGNSDFDGNSGGAASGAPGTSSGGGAGGAGEAAGGGAGGAGGAAGANGASGSGGSGAGTGVAQGVGGAAGYAISKNGKTVTVTNNGTIVGTVG